MTVCVALQPSYIPWRGYFDQIDRADVFVFLDDLQFDRRGWRHRNRFRNRNGSFWVTLGVRLPGGSHGTSLGDVALADAESDLKSHWRSFELAYRRAPYFDLAAELFQSSLRPCSYLTDLTIPSTVEIARFLGLEARFLRSSSLGLKGVKTERLVEICKIVDAHTYVSGPSAKSYLDIDLMSRHGIAVEFMDYSYPSYPQIGSPFDGQVSILDTIAMLGRGAASTWRNDFN